MDADWLKTQVAAGHAYKFEVCANELLSIPAGYAIVMCCKDIASSGVRWSFVPGASSLTLAQDITKELIVVYPRLATTAYKSFADTEIVTT